MNWIEDRYKPLSGMPRAWLLRNPDIVGRCNPFDNGDGLRWAAIFYDRHNVPVHCGEYSNIDAAKEAVENCGVMP